MMNRVIDFSIKHKFFVILFFLLSLGFSGLLIQQMPLDALPDLSDTQTIIQTKWDRSPDIMEDQVTYPIVSALLGTPKVKSIRGFSDFGYSYVYVIFEDSTDIYWARSRVLEYLSKIELPEGVKPILGPDATGLGWVYQYALRSKEPMNLANLRSLQDWDIRFRLQTVDGVSEVASLGGYVKQYQVDVRPDALIRNRLTLDQVIDAVSESNYETSGRLLESDGIEKMIRGRGYIRSLDDLSKSVISVHPDTARPVLLSDVASVHLGPDTRRGVSDFNGEGDAVGGIIIMRNGENAVRVIESVKERLAEIQPSLPAGVTFQTVYDRSDLIRKAIDTLKSTLIKELIVVSLVILLFLRHIPSATTAIITIPASVILAFIPLYGTGVTSNIMSLSGIAISIGVLVDGAIVQVENIYHKTQLWLANGKKGDFDEIRIQALKEVTPSIFFSLLIIAVAFLPIFTLVEQEGRLFHPLAYSKNFAMAIASLLAITLDPAVRMLFHRYEPFQFRPAWLARFVSFLLVGKYIPEEKEFLSRHLIRLYEPICRFVLNHPIRVLMSAFLLMAATIPIYFRLGSEFMPPFQEGSVLYMPVTNPGISIEKARNAMQRQDQILASIPEVKTVLGKAGRAETVTDPAPLSMIETTITLKDKEEWRRKERWYSFLPNFLHGLFNPIWSDRISYDELIHEMDEKTATEEWTNAFTMPIQNRIDMQTTGIRTVAGIKIFGPNLEAIESIGKDLEELIKPIRGTRSVYAERTGSGYFLDYDWNRQALAKYGLTVESASRIVSAAVGGQIVSTVVEGRARYGIQVRYAHDFRESMKELERVMIPTPIGNQIPVSAVATITHRRGPSMIRNEDGLLVGYVFIDVEDRDIGSYVEEAKRHVDKNLKIPPGYTIRFSGQYENLERVSERMKVMIPLTLVLICLLLYWNTKSSMKTLIILTALPFSMIGAIWLLFGLDYHVSVAVWVGIIALLGLDAETGTFMLLYLDLSYTDAVHAGRMRNLDDLKEAIVHGAVRRIRPKMMTVLTGMVGLIPILWSTGAGSDLMKRIAAPMVGGLATSFLLELLLYPIFFYLWRSRAVRSGHV